MILHGQIQSRGGVGTPESQVVIGFVRNTGTDPPQEAIGPIGSNCFLREVRIALWNMLMTKKSQDQFLDPCMYCKSDYTLKFLPWSAVTRVVIDEILAAAPIQTWITATLIHVRLTIPSWKFNYFN